MKTWRYSTTFYVLIALVATGMPVGCVSPAQYDFYALRAAAGTEGRYAATLDTVVLLEPVALPGYLQRPQIVIRRGVALDVNEYHRWGEALSESINRVMAENLSATLADGGVTVTAAPSLGRDYRLSVAFDSFEQVDDRLVLKGGWRLVDADGKRLASGRGDYAMACQAGDYQAMADGLSELLSEFCDGLAGKIIPVLTAE